MDDETVTVKATASTQPQTGFTPTQDGTYWWTASYSGDSNNKQAASNCGDESLTVGAHLHWSDFAEGLVVEANLDSSGA